MNLTLNYESPRHHHVRVIAWLGFESLPHRQLLLFKTFNGSEATGLSSLNQVANRQLSP